MRERLAIALIWIFCAFVVAIGAYELLHVGPVR